MSDFDFNTLVAELVSAAIKRKIRLGDEVDVLDLFPSLDPVQAPLKTFMSDIILRTVYSGFEQVHYLMKQEEGRLKRRLQEAGEACRLTSHRRHHQSPSSSDDERASKEERGRKRSRKGGGAVKKTRAE